MGLILSGQPIGTRTEIQMNEDILAVLDDYEQLSVVEIADVIGAHPVMIDRHCYRLQQDGYIRVYSSGIYQLADDGEAYLTQHRSELRQ